MLFNVPMADVLVVEDNLEIALIVSSILKGICSVHTATTVAEAKSLVSKSRFDLILMDLNLPDGSGLNLISNLNQITVGKEIPFLFVSGDQSTESQLAVLSQGAIDYITKPFNPLILKAKVLNCLRRLNKELDEELILGQLIINRKELRAYKANDKDEKNILDLTALEFRLLTVFSDHFNQALTRSVLIDLVWGENTNVIDRVVDQHIFSLRKKIADSQVQIKSLYGFGYRMESSSES